MTMYRQYQELQDQATRMLAALRNALLADETRDATLYSGEAQSIALDIQSTLQELAGDRHEVLRRSTLTAVQNAVLEAQKVGLGTSVDTMRPYLVDFKTYADFAYAYLTAAVGLEEV